MLTDTHSNIHGAGTEIAGNSRLVFCMAFANWHIEIGILEIGIKYLNDE